MRRIRFPHRLCRRESQTAGEEAKGVSDSWTHGGTSTRSAIGIRARSQPSCLPGASSLHCHTFFRHLSQGATSTPTEASPSAVSPESSCPAAGGRHRVSKKREHAPWIRGPLAKERRATRIAAEAVECLCGAGFGARLTGDDAIDRSLLTVACDGTREFYYGYTCVPMCCCRVAGDRGLVGITRTVQQ